MILEPEVAPVPFVLALNLYRGDGLRHFFDDFGKIGKFHNTGRIAPDKPLSFWEGRLAPGQVRLTGG